MNKILFISIYGHLSYSNAIKKALIKNGYIVYEPEYYVWTDVEEDSHIQKMQNKKYIDAVLKNEVAWILVINHSYVDRSFFDICHKKNIKVFYILWTLYDGVITLQIIWMIMLVFILMNQLTVLVVFYL